MICKDCPLNANGFCRDLCDDALALASPDWVSRRKGMWRNIVLWGDVDQTDTEPIPYPLGADEWAIIETIEELSDLQRDIIRLYYWLGFDHERIAAILDIKVNGYYFRVLDNAKAIIKHALV